MRTLCQVQSARIPLTPFTIDWIHGSPDLLPLGGEGKKEILAVGEESNRTIWMAEIRISILFLPFIRQPRVSCLLNWAFGISNNLHLEKKSNDFELPDMETNLAHWQIKEQFFWSKTFFLFWWYVRVLVDGFGFKSVYSVLLIEWMKLLSEPLFLAWAILLEVKARFSVCVFPLSCLHKQMQRVSVTRIADRLRHDSMRAVLLAVMRVTTDLMLPEDPCNQTRKQCHNGGESRFRCVVICYTSIWKRYFILFSINGTFVCVVGKDFQISDGILWISMSIFKRAAPLGLSSPADQLIQL